MKNLLIYPELLGPPPPTTNFLTDHYLEIGFTLVLLFFVISTFLKSN
jgi:hypothetical protein